MYEFRDVTENKTDDNLPSEALKFNGVYLEHQIPGYRTLYVSGREIMESELSYREGTAVNGSRCDKKRYPSRTITVGYQLIARDAQAFRRAYNKLNAVLDQQEATLIFADEPDKFFVGTKQGGSQVDSGKNSVTGELEFFCADPFKYSVAEKTVLPTLDEGRTFAVDYQGDYASRPILVAEAAGDMGYVSFVNQEGKILQVGSMEESDGLSYQASETLVLESAYEFDASFWQENVAAAEPILANYQQMGSIGVTMDGQQTPLLTASGYGTGEQWHGPSMTRAIPVDSVGNTGAVNGTFSWHQNLVSASAREAGGILFFMTGKDAQGDRTNVAAMWFERTQPGTNVCNVRMFVAGEEKYVYEFSAGNTQNEITGENTGRCDISKFGQTIIFNLSGKKYQVQDPVIADTKITEISVCFLARGSYPAIATNVLHSLKFVTHSVGSWWDIPNKFSEKDVIEVDCEKGEIRLNQISSPQLGALGNDWENFVLHPGSNQIQCIYSDWAKKPALKLKYREVFL